MTKAEKNRLLFVNSIIWIAAMVLPFFLNLALGSTKFPWPILVPLLFIGFLLYSNSVLSRIIGETSDEKATGTAAKI
jgi:hypothetical protein